MHNVKWLLAAGLIAATTAACTEQYGYPSTAYNSGYSTGYYRSDYPSSSTYYSNAYPSYATTSPRRYGPNGDYDRDGIPNRHDRDANGDGIPDRYQR